MCVIFLLRKFNICLVYDDCLFYNYACNNHKIGDLLFLKINTASIIGADLLPAGLNILCVYGLNFGKYSFKFPQLCPNMLFKMHIYLGYFKMWWLVFQSLATLPFINNCKFFTVCVWLFFGMDHHNLHHVKYTGL